jgi:hypothetical protein
LIDLYTVSMSRNKNKCKHPRITRISR